MLLTRARLSRLSSFAFTQVCVQLIGFAVGVLLVRHMAQAQYGYYTLAVSMVSIAVILTDLGLATAVMAVGARHAENPPVFARLLRDAATLLRRMTLVSLAVLVPAYVLLLARQNPHHWQVGALTLLVVATAVLCARGGVALSATRVLGHIALQQKLDLSVNVSKLALVLLVVWTSLTLDATVACAINLAAAAASWVVLRRHLARHLGHPQGTAGDHVAGLADHVRRQAPNSIYFVLNSQLALWLIGFFGNAERVAEVGALGRLGAFFTVIAAVSAALVQPYFARHQGTAELRAGFAGINAFYACLLAALVAAAMLYPGPILWVLGSSYASLRGELVWMIAAATLTAWGGTLYSIGCARGWVLPVSLAAPAGLLATALAASLVDVATVRGAFLINTASGLASMLLALGYFAWQLRCHAQLRVAAS